MTSERRLHLQYNNWENLVIFLEYPKEIRKIIYTTNAIESLNSQFRKVTKNKRVFPNDQSVFKTLYLTIDYISKKWTMPIRNWNETIAHFIVKFEDYCEQCGNKNESIRSSMINKIRNSKEYYDKLKYFEKIYQEQTIFIDKVFAEWPLVEDPEKPREIDKRLWTKKHGKEEVK